VAQGDGSGEGLAPSPGKQNQGCGGDYLPDYLDQNPPWGGGSTPPQKKILIITTYYFYPVRRRL